MHLNLTDAQRQQLIENYIATEPTIYYNTLPYSVSVDLDSSADFVLFYAVDKRDRVGAITCLTRDTWDAIQSGFSMAGVYNTVLDTLEKGLIDTGGDLERSLGWSASPCESSITIHNPATIRSSQRYKASKKKREQYYSRVLKKVS